MDKVLEDAREQILYMLVAYTVILILPVVSIGSKSYSFLLFGLLFSEWLLIPYIALLFSLFVAREKKDILKMVESLNISTIIAIFVVLFSSAVWPSNGPDGVTANFRYGYTLFIFGLLYHLYISYSLNKSKPVDPIKKGNERYLQMIENKQIHD